MIKTIDAERRSIKTPSNKVTVDNRIMEDMTLSWEAKGVLVYLWSFPNGTLTVKDIQNENPKDKITTLKKALRELEKRGLIESSWK